MFLIAWYTSGWVLEKMFSLVWLFLFFVVMFVVASVVVISPVVRYLL